MSLTFSYAVRKLDIPTSTASIVGRHSQDSASGKNAVSCLAAMEGSLVASAGWDSQFHLWDVRASGTTPIASLSLPAKAFCMDVDPTHNRLVVCTAGRKTCVIDVRGAKVDLVLNRESSLKYQTRCVKFFPKGVGLALGSIEGRVAVEFLEDLGIPAGVSYTEGAECSFMVSATFLVLTYNHLLHSNHAQKRKSMPSNAIVSETLSIQSTVLTFIQSLGRLLQVVVMEQLSCGMVGTRRNSPLFRNFPRALRRLPSTTMARSWPLHRVIHSKRVNGNIHEMKSMYEVC